MVGGAEQHPGLRVVQGQLLLGPGDSHIGKPALLLHLGGIEQHRISGEDPFLPAGQEHHWEFQALGGVDSHKHHRIVFFIVIVDVRKQGHLLQEAGKACFLPVFLLIAADHGGKLLHVFPAALGLFRLPHAALRDIYNALEADFVLRVIYHA